MLFLEIVSSIHSFATRTRISIKWHEFRAFSMPSPQSLGKKLIATLDKHNGVVISAIAWVVLRPRIDIQLERLKHLKILIYQIP